MKFRLVNNSKLYVIMIMNKHAGISLITFLLLYSFVLTNVLGQSIPDRPVPPRLVNDFAKILTQQEVATLEQKLVRFNDTTSNQITIVTVNSLDGLTPSMFAYEIGAKWSVGQKRFDNGIVVLVKPKLSSSDKGKVYIAVGYGLEPAIPDAITKRIVDNEMIPYFRNDDYYGGINQATNVLMKLASGEISADGYKKQTGAPGIFSLIPFVIIIIIIVLIRKSGGKSQGIGRSNNSLWTALWLGSMMSNSGSSSGSWGNFSGGDSGFGGGGGFGGFGGGSFGGGGAGGSW